MKKLTHAERELCSLQAQIFEASITASEDSSAVFIRRFMRSDFARRFDDDGYPSIAINPNNVVREIDLTFKAKTYGSEKYSANEMHWMGYFYRCLCCVTGKNSKQAYKIIGANELRKLYFPYHSLEAEQAVERVIEAKCTDQQSQIEYGVQTLKALRGIS